MDRSRGRTASGQSQKQGNQNMVKTKSAYGHAEPSDGSRYLVSRYWPRGISKQRLQLTTWLKQLAPSKELLRDWKDGAITWED